MVAEMDQQFEPKDWCRNVSNGFIKWSWLMSNPSLVSRLKLISTVLGWVSFQTISAKFITAMGSMHAI